MTTSQSLAIRYRRDPIAGLWRPIKFPLGMSLAEIADELVLEHKALKPFLQARVGGHIVPREYWRGFRPFARSRGDDMPVFVDFEVALAGGRTAWTVAALALAVASTAASAGALGPVWGTAFAAGSWGSRIAAGAFAIGSALAAQNIMPAMGPQDALGTTPLGVAGTSLQLKPFAPLPWVLGEDRVEPEPVIQPYNTWKSMSDEQVTYVGGYAGRHLLSDPRSGLISLTGAADTEVEIREGAITDDPIDWLTEDGTVVQQNTGITLSRFKTLNFPGFGNVEADPNVADPLPVFHRVRASKDCEHFRFMFYLPGFIYHSEADGDQGLILPLRFRMRLNGGTWQNLPDIFLWGLRRPVRAIFNIKWVDAIPGTAGNDWDNSATEWPGVGWLYLRAIEAGSEDFATPTGVSGYTQWEWDGWKVTLYLMKSLYPVGAYEFEVKRGWAANNDDFGPDSHNYFGFSLDSSTTIENPMNMEDEIVLQYVQSIYPDEYPIDDSDGEPDAKVAIRRTNAGLDVVTCIASAYLFDPGVTPIEAPSSNPAVCYYNVLGGAQAPEPVNDSRINIERILDWQEWCDENGKACNLVVRGERSPDVLKAIALLGQARPIFAPLHSVAIDRLESGIVGLITKRNARFGPVQKGFALTPHALSSSFRDKNDDYAVKEITQFADGYNADGSAGKIEATRYETQDYRGFTDEARLRERMLFDLRWLKNRGSIFPAIMDIEYFELEPGQKVGMSNDFVGTTHGDARVREILKSGSNVTGFILDEIAERGSGSSDLRRIVDLRVVSDLRRPGGVAGAAIRLRDGTVRVEELADADAELSRINFATPFAMPTSGGIDLIVEGALLTMGSHGNEYRRMQILDIRPLGAGEAEVRLVDDRPDQMYVPEAPDGFIYLTDLDGVLLTDSDGELLYEAVA